MDMRYLITLVESADIHSINESELRLPKPNHTFVYSSDGDEGHLYYNPNAGLAAKLIGQFDNRALIYSSGTLVMWPELDMYHGDVYPEINLPGDYLLLQMHPSGAAVPIAVKADNSDQEPIPFTDKNWLTILHNHRTLAQLYGSNFKVVEMGWW